MCWLPPPPPPPPLLLLLPRVLHLIASLLLRHSYITVENWNSCTYLILSYYLFSWILFAMFESSPAVCFLSIEITLCSHQLLYSFEFVLFLHTMSSFITYYSVYEIHGWFCMTKPSQFISLHPSFPVHSIHIPSPFLCLTYSYLSQTQWFFSSPSHWKL